MGHGVGERVTLKMAPNMQMAPSLTKSYFVPLAPFLQKSPNLLPTQESLKENDLTTDL